MIPKKEIYNTKPKANLAEHQGKVEIFAEISKGFFQVLNVSEVMVN